MANVLVEENSIQDIADAIREKNGKQTLYKPGEMADAVRSITTTDRKPTSIEVVRRPKKVYYQPGDTIDYTGISVRTVNEDGTTFTDETYPDGRIPFAELVFPMEKAGSDKSVDAVGLKELYKGKEISLYARLQPGGTSAGISFTLDSGGTSPVYAGYYKDGANYVEVFLSKAPFSYKCVNNGYVGVARELENGLYSFSEFKMPIIEVTQMNAEISSYKEAENAVLYPYTPTIPVQWFSPYTQESFETSFVINAAPPDTVEITQNGTHDVYDYSFAAVNVQPVLQAKTVTTNGIVTPDAGYDGMSSVNVNVSGVDYTLEGTPIAQASASDYDGTAQWGDWQLFGTGTALSADGAVHLPKTALAYYSFPDNSNTITVYAIVKQAEDAAHDYDTGIQPIIISMFYAASTRNSIQVVRVTDNRDYIGYGLYGVDHEDLTRSAYQWHVFALRVEQAAKRVTYFINGEKVPQQEAFNNVGRHVCISDRIYQSQDTPAVSASNLSVDVLYAGIFDGAQTDETIIENSRKLMWKYGLPK